jgi:hypothetical protein
MLVSLFKNIVPLIKSGGKWRFEYGDKGFQNLLSDTITEKNVVWLNHDLSYSINLKQTPVQEPVFNVEIFICQKSELDWTPQQREKIFLECMQVQREIISKLLESNLVQNVNQGGINNISGLFIINAFDSNRDGIKLNFGLKLKDVSNRCYDAV